MLPVIVRGGEPEGKVVDASLIELLFSSLTLADMLFQTMCNLYRMTASVDEMRRVFGPFEGERLNLPSFDEIFPGYQAPVIRREGAKLALQMMKWGFPGPAAAGGRLVTNVRNLSSPFWRSALKDPRRRCIVPVTQFCEWTAQADPATGRKRKVWFGLNEGNDPVFAFAGLWRPTDEGASMAFLTCEPNALVGPVHPKAMPVILGPSDIERWLEDEMADACSLARPFAAHQMQIVS